MRLRRYKQSHKQVYSTFKWLELGTSFTESADVSLNSRGSIQDRSEPSEGGFVTWKNNSVSIIEPKFLCSFFQQLLKERML